MRHGDDAVYDVALSFAGEDGLYVRQVADQLKEVGVRVFYHRYEEAELWGENLYQHLHDVYAKRARFTVVFVSRHYAEKAWTNHELKAAQEKAFKEREESILLARFDETELPGVSQVDVYQDLRQKTPAALANLIVKKLATKGIGPGATPTPRAERLVETQRVPAVMQRLIQVAREDALTLVIGPHVASGSPGLPPSPFEITRLLLMDLALINANYDELFPRLNTAADYYAVSQGGEDALEGKVCDFIREKSTSIAPIHGLVAEIVQICRPRRRRLTNLDPPLIVTTNLDLGLERALLLNNVPFIRIVQGLLDAPRTGAYMEVSRSATGQVEVVTADESTLTAPANNLEELDKLIERAGDAAGKELQSLVGACAKDGAPRPVLYKSLGSQDVRESCVISADQVLGYASRWVPPDRISKIVQRSAVIVTGYSVLDPEFRVMYRGWLEDSLRQNKKRAKLFLQCPEDPNERDPYRKWDAQFRETLEMETDQLGLPVVESKPDKFLETLKGQLGAN